MSRDRDPFERTLDLLRRGLRAGDHGLGQPLHIKKLAAAMAVSSTPVREALARLSGEGLIERAQSGYLTRRYDVVGLRELYQLDQVYALAAPIKGGKSEGTRTDHVAPADAGDPGMEDYVASTEVLLTVLSPQDSRTLAVARQRVWDRLAPFRAVEPVVLSEVEPEVVRLRDAVRNSMGAPRVLIRAYYRRRLQMVGALLRSASARRYLSNIP